MLPVEGELPPLDGLGPWFNSPPLTREQQAYVTAVATSGGTMSRGMAAS